jgi:lipid-binding SYLF domain-containing protein
MIFFTTNQSRPPGGYNCFGWRLKRKATFLRLALSTVGSVYAAPEYVERLKNAADVLTEIMSTPDSAIPQDLLNKSYCVIVVPGLKKAGFIVAARYGKGSCRKKSLVGWTAPGTVRIEGGSFGFQIGAAETDVIMLIMNERGMDRLFTSQFTLGGDASVAAGPVGRSISAQIGAFLTAEILSWSRSRGVFTGVALTGATLRQDVSDNRELYGKPLENREIIEGDLAVPKPAKALLSVLNRYSSRR